MSANQVLNAYRQTGKQATVHPVKLVHMIYERLLAHLELAEDGVREKNPGKRGENLSKAIALISELNSSVKQDDQSEAAEFLRGLYESILLELPKVSISGDIKIIKQASSYISRLKEIWEDTAMQENGFSPKNGTPPKSQRNPEDSIDSNLGARGSGEGKNAGLSARLSVSI